MNASPPRVRSELRGSGSDGSEQILGSLRDSLGNGTPLNPFGPPANLIDHIALKNLALHVRPYCPANVIDWYSIKLMNQTRLYAMPFHCLEQCSFGCALRPAR